MAERGDERPSIGARLRARREERGETLKDVENITKIRTRYLEALEADDVKTLPAEVYALGFLRAYARHLGLDSEGLVRDWRALRDGDQAAAPPAASDMPSAPVASTPPRRSRPPTSPRRGAPGPILGAMAVLALILVALLWGLHHAAQPTSAPTSAPSSSAHHSHKPPSSSSTSSPSSTSSAAALVTTVNNAQQLTLTQSTGTPSLTLQFSGRCWVEVWIDGVTSNSSGHTYTAGESASFSGARSVEVRLGNPDVVTAVADGQSLGNVGHGYVRNILLETSS